MATISEITDDRPVVLDTEIWVYFILGSKRLKGRKLDIVEDAIFRGKAYISVISLWETAESVNSGELKLTMPVKQWLDESIEKSFVQVIDMTTQIIVDSTTLPASAGDLDEIDKIIVATARSQNAVLVTDEENIIKYANTGHVIVAE